MNNLIIVMTLVQPMMGLGIALAESIRFYTEAVYRRNHKPIINWIQYNAYHKKAIMIYISNRLQYNIVNIVHMNKSSLLSKGYILNDTFHTIHIHKIDSLETLINECKTNNVHSIITHDIGFINPKQKKEVVFWHDVLQSKYLKTLT